MHKLTKCWDAVDSKFGWHSDVLLGWQKTLAEELALVSHLFGMNGKISPSYPCIQPWECSSRHYVEHYRDDEFTGFPLSEAQECEAFALTRQDVLLHELDMVAVWGDVAQALGIMPLPLRFSNPIKCFQLGHMGPGRMPVYVAKTAELRQTIQELVLDNDEPFILLASNARRYCDDCDRLMRRRKALFLPIGEDIGLDADGKWTVAPTLLEALQDVAGSRLQQNVCVQEGGDWRVVYQGESAQVPALRGMLYLSLLLGSPRKVWSNVIDKYSFRRKKKFRCRDA